MDPRATKDFIPPTMDAKSLENFQKAFHHDGYIWIWGCAFPRLVHEMLSKIERHPSYKNSGVGDDVVFKITNFNLHQANYLEDWIKRDLGAPFPDKKNIEIKFKFLKHFFCLMTTSSYAHEIAKQTKVKVFGGVMGTWTEQDSGAPLPLMRVHSAPFSRRHFTFYKNYLGFDFDPEDRNYGEYSPGFICTKPTP